MVLTQLEDVGNILHNICEESISKDDITTSGVANWNWVFVWKSENLLENKGHVSQIGLLILNL